MALCLPFSAHAGVILQQTIDTTSANSNNSFQPLGTGLSGYAGSIDFTLANSNGGTQTLGFHILKCTDSTYTSCSKTSAYSGYQYTYSVAGSQPKAVINVSVATSSWSFDPAFYYGINYESNNPTFVSIYGSNATSSLPNADPAANHRVGAIPCSTTCATPTASQAVKQLYFTLYDVLGPSEDTTTRLVTVTPAASSTIATSTTATFGATGYVNSNDFVSGMFVQIRYASYSSMQSYAGASPDLFYTTLQFPISAAGTFSVSTTSPALTVGLYTMQSDIRTTSWTNSLLNFFGFGQFAQQGILTATSTVFTAAHLSGYDTFVASTTEAMLAYTASSTISLASCSTWTGFNLGDCLGVLLLPQVQPMQAQLSAFKDGFLTYAPWGYLTRFVVIMSGGATSTLPSFSATLPLGSADDLDTFTFDMNDMVTGGAALLDSIPARDNATHTIKTVMRPWIDLFIGLFVLLIMVKDLMGMAAHGRHNFKS